MPIYRVESGDFQVSIHRRSARRAAADAIGLLKRTEDDVRLGMMTGVHMDDGEILYLSTIVLMNENGIKFRIEH